MIGSLLQKEYVMDAISSMMKAATGLMVFNIESSAMLGVVQTSTGLFNTVFGIEGVTTQMEVATSLILNTYGTEMALIMLLGFVVNLIVVEFIRSRVILFTGQHFPYLACVIILTSIASDLPTPLTITAGGILFGLCGTALPSLCQPFMNKATGADNLAMGHFSCIGYVFSRYIGKLLGRMGKNAGEEEDTSTVNILEFLGLFRDFIFSITLFMIVLSYMVVVACMVNDHMDIVPKKAGSDIWFIYPFLQDLQFAAGMSVPIYGVRQSTAEITAALTVISEKYIPNSKPAVNCSTIFPLTLTAMLAGLVGVFVGGFVAVATTITCNSSVIMTPAAGTCFFSDGIYDIFGDVYGGWKGVLIGFFIVGMALTGLLLTPYPTFVDLGISGTSFPNIDYNIIGVFLSWILGIFA